MNLSKTQFQKYHSEVVNALKAIGKPALGKAIQKDRGSQLEHLGISFPNLRKRVRQGFSFYSLSEDQILEIWDALWKQSPYADVFFAALEFYIPLVRKGVPPKLWRVVKNWTDRIDNWCHADNLSAIYSRILESQFDEVYPQLKKWNQAAGEWERRISLVSLIHYSGKNAVFLPPQKVLPLLTNCLSDPRYYVQTAVGWVLREMGNVYKSEITKYIEINIESISTPAFSRALERKSATEKNRLRKLRKLNST
jgi:3-methyladenine DNA glycosylase AlkD